jgi:cytoskeletal protein CcmA (bactofilin family)
MSLHLTRTSAVVLAAGLLVLGTGAAAAGAAPAPHSDVVAAAAADDREGPQFYTGVIIDVSGSIDGDVYASGQSVIISGDVTGDVIAAAQTITVTGTVDGNVRLAGQDVSITGEVSRSGTIFAANVTVGDGGSFGDDLVVGASLVRIAGDIGRDVQAATERLTVDGSVGGNVTYYSNNEASIADGSVTGTVEQVEPPQTPRVEVSPWAVFFGWFLGVFYALVALSLITLLAGLLLPRWLHRVTDHLVPSPWKALLVGFVASIAVPMALLFLAVTIIGAPLALAGLLVWILLLLATFVYSAYYIGRLLFRGTQHPVVKALVGGVILIVALQIPWLNVLVWLAMIFFGLGAQLLEFQRQRPWHLTPSTTAEISPAPTGTIPPATTGTAAPAPDTTYGTPPAAVGTAPPLPPLPPQDPTQPAADRPPSA